MNRWIAPLLFLSMAWNGALAQRPGGVGPATTPPLLPNGRPYSPPGAAVVPAPTPDNDTVRLQFPNTDIQPILKVYEQLTGKRIVTDNTVVGTISIDITRPVSREEAIRIIETSLYVNGFALVPGEGNLVKLVGAGKNPRNFGVNIYSDISQIPDDVSVASVMFQLQYADSKDAKAAVDLVLQPGSPYTLTVPLPGSLFVTESTIMLRNIAKIIAVVDVEPAEVVSHFYDLHRANAKDVVDKLNKLFEKGTQGGGAGGPSTAPLTRPLIQPNGQPAPAGSIELPAATTGLSEDSIIVGKIKVDFDERTNRIHVVTRPQNLRFIGDLIGQYDEDVQFGQPKKRLLKYVNAGDELDVIVKAITEPGEKAEGDTGGAGNKAQEAQATQATNNTTNGNESFGGSNGNSGGGGLNITEGLETPTKDTTPKAVVLGSTKIIADPRENSIIVLGNEEVRQKIFTLLDQLDVPAPQVMIQSVVGEYTLTNDSNLGVDYLLHYPAGPLANLLSGSSSSTLGSTGFLNGHSGAAVSNFTNTPLSTSLASAVGAGSGFTAAIGAANSLDVIVNALLSTGKFHITNTPRVFASNNQKAMIVSGQQIPVPTSTLSNLTASGVTNSTAAVQSSINYVQVALQLEVVPVINSDREVNLDILQKLDSPGATTNVGGSNVPAINTRYIRTNVTVQNNATIVLGGLITRTVGGSNQGVPFLSKIPVLGYLFGNKAKQDDRSELIVLIRPTVTTSPQEIADESHVERQRLLMEPDIDSTIAAPTPQPGKGVNFRFQDETKVQ